jgi:dCTP deaminase
MLLSSDRIRELVQNHATQDDPLAVTPILDWDAQAKPGSCSIDVRLGQRFIVPRRARLDTLDHMSDDYAHQARRYSEMVRVTVGDYFVLHPRQFVLGETLEWIRLPRSLAASVAGRSAWGRDGLIVATATGVHPGYAGVLALEITNLGEIPLRLYPGTTIAQLFFYHVDHIEGAKTPTSPFMASSSPRISNPVGSERDAIRSFKRLSRRDEIRPQPAKLRVKVSDIRTEGPAAQGTFSASSPAEKPSQLRADSDTGEP